jgi:hypothetical protein
MLSALLVTGSGRAQDEPTAEEPVDVTQQCVDAHLENQRLRKAGKLLEAKKQLLVCVQEACPEPIKNDCGGWLSGIDSQIPSIVVSAKDQKGADTVDVRVFIDGEKVADQLDGVPISIDPGPHDVKCEHGGATDIEKVVIVQAQKSRAVACSFVIGEPKPPPKPDVVADGTTSDRGHPIAGYVLGVLSLGAFASFAALGIIGKNEADDLNQSCGKEAPPPRTQTCTDEQIDPVRAKLIAADVSLGVGVALLAVSMGLILHHFLSAPDDAPAAALRFDVGPTLDATRRVDGGLGAITVTF